MMEQDRRKTVIAITHRISTIKLASRIIFLANGEITGDNTFEKLYSQHLAFRQQIEAMKVQSRE